MRILVFLFGYLLAVSATVCEDCAVEKTSNCPSGTVLYDCNDAASAGTAWIRKNAVSSYIGANCWNGNWLSASACQFVSGAYFCKYTCPVTYKRNETKRDDEQSQFLLWSSVSDYFSTSSFGPRGERVWRTTYPSAINTFNNLKLPLQFVRPFVEWVKAKVTIVSASTGLVSSAGWTWPILNPSPVYLGKSACDGISADKIQGRNFIDEKRAIYSSPSWYPACDVASNYGVFSFDFSQNNNPFSSYIFDQQVVNKLNEWRSAKNPGTGCTGETVLFDRQTCYITGAPECDTLFNEVDVLRSNSNGYTPPSGYPTATNARYYSPTTTLSITIYSN
jgi:hypothetical protein